MKVLEASKLAVCNVLKEGLTDIFPPPHEVRLLENEKFQKKIIDEVAKCINGSSLESLAIGSIDHVLLPKTGAFDFRRCALIHPLDTIKYLALSLCFADSIEKLRPSNSRRIVYSYRFHPNKGHLFHPKYNFTAFRRRASQGTKKIGAKFLVSCDIANFYDRLNIHRLESILTSLKLDKLRIRQLNELLLFWANRDSYGLPVGSNASRILAEAALLEVDNYLLSIGVKFCRFVDDYRLFAPNVHIAHQWLTQLIERLWLEGLTINKGKTKIEDVSQMGQFGAEIDKAELEGKIQSKHSKRKSEDPQPQFRIVAGYGGAIPTRFRQPSKNEIARMKGSDPVALLKELKATNLPTPEDIVHFVKALIAQGDFKGFAHLPEIASRFPQFTPYIVDFVIKYSDEVPPPIRRKITASFSKCLLKTTYLPEYITIEIVRLLGAVGYEDKETLLDYFRALKRSAGAYIGRALLDALEKQLSRGETVEIRKQFGRADPWEKRQIVRIVDSHLSDDEKRPWLKNVRIQEARDLFLAEYIRPTR